VNKHQLHRAVSFSKAALAWILPVVAASLIADCGGDSHYGVWTTPAHAVGGTVSGLLNGGLVLQNNGGDNLTISANGQFTFPTSLVAGSSYAVTVVTQPPTPPQNCTVTAGTGTVAANVMSVNVACRGIQIGTAVQSIHLISGVQQGTRCTLTYRLLVRGDVRPYRSGVLNITTTNPALTVLTKQIEIPEIDAEQLMLSTAPLMVSVDPERLVPPVGQTVQCQQLGPFSLADFSFSFTGQSDGTSALAGTLRIGEIQFLEGGGRPGHEGVFPIQGDSPPAGAALVMEVAVFGGPSSTTYRVLDVSGQTILGGSLTAQSTDVYYAGFIVPEVPFRVEISAVGSASAKLTWRSRLYNPAQIALRVVPVSVAVTPGQSVPIQLELNSAHVQGSYLVTMYLPDGFSDMTGPQTASVTAGSKTILRATFVVQATVRPYKQYPVVVEAVGTDTSLPTVSATLQFEVE
jgi:hypothetical protein